MKFSIIVVCLNAGLELRATIKSIITQTYKDFEIIVKDGGSTDGSLEGIPDDGRIRLIQSADSGIYDAMNQALEEAKGEYIYFLNCGDYLYDENVLQRVVQALEQAPQNDEAPVIVYGDILERISQNRVASNPAMDEFACYRNVPCHQACFYDREMIKMHPFSIQYKVRADYEQFLWCFFIAKANLIYIDNIIASYMGGGFSENKKNRKLSAEEHITIVENYMPHKNIVKYRWRMRLSMAPLRAFISRNPVTGGIYNKIKSSIYSKKR